MWGLEAFDRISLPALQLCRSLLPETGPDHSAVIPAPTSAIRLPVRMIELGNVEFWSGMSEGTPR